MFEITPRTFKGTRDFMPHDMRIRESIIEKMKEVFTRYGFAPLETPAMEFLDILTGKYGSEADKLLYPLAYKGGRELALRYDLTVPLARVIAMNPHLPKPFKRFQIQPVWRADNPQLKRGRFREFYQCDVDTVGSAELMSDAEIIAVMIDVFWALDLQAVEVRLNSRTVLRGIVLQSGLPVSAEQDVCRIIDKLDKEGMDFVKNELMRMEYPPKSVDYICKILHLNQDLGLTMDELLREVIKLKEVNEIFRKGTGELHEIIGIVGEMVSVPKEPIWDISLARGLDYYTGPIFEVVLPEQPQLGAVAGGGRYDDLVGMFMKESMPAVGTSFGLERIQAVLQSRFTAGSKEFTEVDFLVCYFNAELRSECLRITREIRSTGRRVEMYHRPDKMKKQFSYADKKHIPFVLIYGPDEKAAGKITVKNMKNGFQDTIDKSNITDWVQKVLLQLYH